VYLRSFIAILVIAAMPLCSQAQQRGNPDIPMPTKTDAQRVVQIISGDKTKMQQYCELVTLVDQMGQAGKRRDTKKVVELFDKAFELGQRLGPEYNALIDKLEQLDPHTKESHEITAMLYGLNKLCAKK
jgi:hypothetical protein